jgi:hypothetical protein
MSSRDESRLDKKELRRTVINCQAGKRIARNLKRASTAAVFRLRTLVMGYGAFPLSASEDLTP